MNFALAVKEDLPRIKETFDEIVKYLQDSGIHIWDEEYPYYAFVEDVELKRLYVLKDKERIVSAFSLCDDCEAAKLVQWKDNAAAAVYLFRLGVNVKNLRQGIAAKMIDNAKAIAKEKNLEYLRLFVAGDNIPAIRLYENSGFVKAEGSYDEVLNDKLIHELGFEIKV